MEEISKEELPVDIACAAGHTPTEKKLSVRACNVLNELRLSQKLCDAILVCDDGTNFPVHRAVMASASDFFKALFTNDFNEALKAEIHIKGVGSDMMKLCIEWVYICETDINEDNVLSLLRTADYLSILDLLAKCNEFLTQQITPENCIGIRNFARTFCAVNLAKTAQSFLLRNFCEVRILSEEWLKLSLDDITEILHDDLLNVKNEEMVFETLISWINYDPAERKTKIFKLLREVRLGRLTSQYFEEHVASHIYIKDSDDCKPLIINALKKLYDWDTREPEEYSDDDLSRPRIPHEMIMAVGGWSGGYPTACLETYDSRVDRWILCDVTDGPIVYHGCAYIDQKVYLVGGFDGIEYFNSVKLFDPVAKTWEERAPMHNLRCYVSVAVLEGKIYALGGFDGHFRLHSAERYCPDTNQWTLLQSMHALRSDASATSLNGRVYICGGFNGQECLSSVEYYDPITSLWIPVAHMINRRSGVSVIALEGYVYAVGGFNGIVRMTSAERFNPRTNQWTAISDMASPRSNFAIEVLDDKIFAIGGFNGVAPISMVECYDPSKGEWCNTSTINNDRSALSVCVVSGLPNMLDYLSKRQKPIIPPPAPDAYSDQSPQTAVVPVAAVESRSDVNQNVNDNEAAVEINNDNQENVIFEA